MFLIDSGTRDDKIRIRPPDSSTLTFILVLLRSLLLLCKTETAFGDSGDFCVVASENKKSDNDE